jgi:signal peptidase I
MGSDRPALNLRASRRREVSAVTRRLCLLVAVGTLAIGWLLFAPRQLGGTAAYVATHGVSMEPRFHTGDLAVLRPGPYHVGDVVAYRSALMHSVVMHRIVAIRQGRYTFKGDNNSWLDPERPTVDRLIGKLVARIPRGGSLLRVATSPGPMALFALPLFATGAGAVLTRPTRRKRGAMSRHAAPRRRPRPRVSLARSPYWTAMVVAAASGLASVVLGAWAWTAAPMATVISAVKQSQSLSYSYTAAVPRTAAYDSTTVASPEPVFRRLADRVDVHYLYAGPPCTIRVTVHLSSPGGWQSTLAVRAPADVVASPFAGALTLDLRQLDARARAAALVTGVASEQLLVTVTARVTTAGSSFEAKLPLTVTPVALTLNGDASALNTAHATSRPQRITVPRKLHLLGYHLSVETARGASAFVLVATVISVIVIAALASRDAGAGEGARIRRRYAQLLVAVQPMAAPCSQAVDVGEFATLVRIAERSGLLILHWSRNGVETFTVHDEGSTYRYRIGHADGHLGAECASLVAATGG